MIAASFRYFDLCLMPLNESSLYFLGDLYSSFSHIGTNHFSGRMNKFQHPSEWANPLSSSELLGLMSPFQVHLTFFSGPGASSVSLSSSSDSNSGWPSASLASSSIEVFAGSVPSSAAMGSVIAGAPASGPSDSRPTGRQSKRRWSPAS